MDLADIKKKRDKLEENIFKLLNDFQQETECTPTGVILSTGGSIDVQNIISHYLSSVSVSIKI